MHVARLKPRGAQEADRPPVEGHVDGFVVEPRPTTFDDHQAGPDRLQLPSCLLHRRLVAVEQPAIQIARVPLDQHAAEVAEVAVAGPVPRDVDTPADYEAVIGEAAGGVAAGR